MLGIVCGILLVFIVVTQSRAWIRRFLGRYLGRELARLLNNDHTLSTTHLTATRCPSCALEMEEVFGDEGMAGNSTDPLACCAGAVVEPEVEDDDRATIAALTADAATSRASIALFGADSGSAASIAAFATSKASATAVGSDGGNAAATAAMVASAAASIASEDALAGTLVNSGDDLADDAPANSVDDLADCIAAIVEDSELETLVDEAVAAVANADDGETTWSKTGKKEIEDI